MTRVYTTTPVPVRFWAKVNRTLGCWEWTASKRPNGYGQFGLSAGVIVYAHRWVYERMWGPIPDGLRVDHTCHNRACVKPTHLRLVTAKQNSENRAGANKGSASGVRGVNRNGKRWMAMVKHNRRAYYLGLFDDVEKAEAAVVAKRRELFTHNEADYPERCGE